MTEREIFELAKSAAQKASDEKIEHATTWYPCGFAYVNIRPARGKFVKFLKDNNIGYKAYEGGYTISSHDMCSQPSAWCQSMDVKYAGAVAFAAVLREHGINANESCRMD